MSIRIKILTGPKSGSVIAVDPDPLLSIFLALGLISCEPEERKFLGTTWGIFLGDKTGIAGVRASCDRCSLTATWLPTAAQLKAGAKPEDFRFGPHCPGGKFEKTPAHICEQFRAATREDKQTVGVENPVDRMRDSIARASGSTRPGSAGEVIYSPGDYEEK